MSLIIRKATELDAVLIADISHQTFYDAFAADNKPSDMEKFLKEQFPKGKLILEVSARENLFLLAYRNDEVAGYVKLRDSVFPPELGKTNALEIARIYTMKTMIGTGIGKALMQKCLDIAREQGKQVLWLGVWEKNNRAIDFYTKWGFEKFGETDFLLGDDIQRDWLMKKTI
jgi:diamine N-acetyltransferase